jgi:hypothetical protein
MTSDPGYRVELTEKGKAMVNEGYCSSVSKSLCSGDCHVIHWSGAKLPPGIYCSCGEKVTVEVDGEIEMVDAKGE